MSERNEADKRWYLDQSENGWKLDPAPLPFRLPIIRWFRFTWKSWQVERHASAWAGVGVGIGGPNQYDCWVLYAIYRGWA